MKLNLLIRGHVRNSFEDSRLFTLVSHFINNYDVNIFVHSWNKIQNNLSWRHVDDNSKEVNENQIINYFKEYESNIKSILIDDDQKIQLHGNTEGRIGHTPCPVLAWKNMYYGKVRLIDHVAEMVDGKEVAVQTRFDFMSNLFSPEISEVANFLSHNYGCIGSEGNIEKIRFLRMHPFVGVDNIYMSTVADMRKFMRYMYYDMDRILHVHRGTIHQEHICFHERLSPFTGE